MHSPNTIYSPISINHGKLMHDIWNLVQKLLCYTLDIEHIHFFQQRHHFPSHNLKDNALDQELIQC